MFEDLSKLKLLFSRDVNEKNAYTDLEKQFGRKEKFWNSTSKCDNEGEKRVRQKLVLFMTFLEVFHFSFDLLNFVIIFFLYLSNLK